jgi:hypothetical protein
MWAVAVLVVALALRLAAAVRRFVLRVLILCVNLAIFLIRMAQRVVRFEGHDFMNARKPGAD